MNRRHALCLIATLFAGCASPGPVEPERFFRPDLAAPALRLDTPLRIVVEPPEVHGIYADRAFVSRAADGAYRQSTGRSWVGPPSLLFGDILVDYLRAAYGEDSVFAPQARVSGDLSLRTKLQRLERQQGQDGDGGGASGGDRALLAIEFVLGGRGGALLGSLVFKDSLPAGSTPADYVAAQSQLLTRACEQLLALLDRTLPTVAPAATNGR